LYFSAAEFAGVKLLKGTFSIEVDFLLLLLQWMYGVASCLFRCVKLLAFLADMGARREGFGVASGFGRQVFARKYGNNDSLFASPELAVLRAPLQVDANYYEA
jgi:hypothetical protein